MQRFVSEDPIGFEGGDLNLARYVGNNPLSWIDPEDERFRRTDSLGSRDFITDALGSTVALADGTGIIQTSYTYEPYGNTTTGQASSNPYQYTGRENDGTGLYYYRARYYDPVRQRFISQDPIGLAGGLNTYSYVLNNPLRYSDPLGLEGQCASIDCIIYGGTFPDTSDVQISGDDRPINKTCLSLCLGSLGI